MKNIKPWIYAGAFLANSRIFIKAFFHVVAEMRAQGTWDEQIRIYFIGTGSYSGKLISEYAQESGISDIVTEDRSRYPFLHVLNFLSAANTVMVVGKWKGIIQPPKFISPYSVRGLSGRSFMKKARPCK